MAGNLTIISQPQDVHVFVGDAAEFCVDVIGTEPYSYKWFRNGVEILDATKSKFKIDNVTADDNGAEFQVMATNVSCDGPGLVTSNIATLNIISCDLAITKQPKSQHKAVGCTAKFHVEVQSSCDTPTFTWFVNGNPVANSNKSTLRIRINSTTPADNSIWVVVTNATGSITSNTVSLIVGMVDQPGQAPIITKQPENVAVAVGQNATFSVNATSPDNSILSYRWLKNGNPISDANSSSYTTSNVQMSDNNSSFSVIVSNMNGTVSSTGAVLTVAAVPVIDMQPQDQTITIGQSATFSVVATGAAPLSYQWFADEVAISGATSPTFTTLLQNKVITSQPYFVVVSNNFGSVTSNTVFLNVNFIGSAPLIRFPPQNTTVGVGTNAVFTVQASGATPLTYKWFVGGVEQAGVVGPILTFGPTTLANNGKNVIVIVSNQFGSITSAPATLIVTTSNDPHIITQPVSVSVKSGATATFSIVADGTQQLTYQWFNQFGAISGATSSIYSTIASSNTSGWRLFCIVTNPHGQAVSNTVTLTIKRNLMWLWIMLAIMAFVVFLVVILVLIFAPKRKVYVPVEEAKKSVVITQSRPARPIENVGTTSK